MKHLFEYGVFEVEQGCFAPEKEELEKLPEFQKIVELVRELGFNISRYYVYQPGDPTEYRWEINPRSYKSGVREVFFPIAYYYFRINPCRGTIYYGQELVNKGGDLPFNSIEDWNSAYRQIGIYSIARRLDIRKNVMDNLLSDPIKLVKYFEKIRIEQQNPDDSIDREYNLYLYYLIGNRENASEIVIKAFADLVKKDLSYLNLLPKSVDKQKILVAAGYDPSTAKGLIKFNDAFGF